MSLYTAATGSGLLTLCTNVYYPSKLLIGLLVVILLIRTVVISVVNKKSKGSNAIANFSKFFYATFLKPHDRNGTHSGQQAALESFYKAQVSKPDDKAIMDFGNKTPGDYHMCLSVEGDFA